MKRKLREMRIITCEEHKYPHGECYRPNDEWHRYYVHFVSELLTIDTCSKKYDIPEGYSGYLLGVLLGLRITKKYANKIDVIQLDIIDSMSILFNLITKQEIRKQINNEITLVTLGMIDEEISQLERLGVTVKF